ncbi:gliding motility-associated C-terminal domain-containing protein [Ferruginibacter albus]|uniref:gliding motility-associated C-terminal domain-containing protein n=1 Tax=Ferruginibacter albus TaxID=2875540 RepID=UPI001CC3CAC9|nr:gliding motility-associated C-terminal domain-containing protein [Ferruginibacter albus]UAY51888.1 gliding motility-associated C-terminal domain-containing protein [Ferruginibacter albus]
MYHLKTPFFFLYFLLPFFSFAQVQIDSIKTTISDCANNGSVTIYAKGTTGNLFYSIIAGPVTQPAQVSNIFNSLPPGTNYIVGVSDGINNSIQNFTITGSYTSPDFTAISTSPYCTGGNDGRIIGNRDAGTGKPPYTWQLIAPVTSAQQVSDTFPNLSAGNYTVRLTDGCGSFRTGVVTISNPATTFNFYGPPQVEGVGCDSISVYTTLQFDPASLRPPFSFKYQTKNGTYTPAASATTIDSSNVNSGYIYISHIVPGLTYGDTFNIAIYNACRDSQRLSYYVLPYIFAPYYSFDSCGINAYALYSYYDNYNYYQGLKTPVTYSYTDSATNAVVDAGVLKSDTAVFPYHQITRIISITPALVQGRTYKLTVRDGCGKLFEQNYTIPFIAQPAIIEKVILYSSCIDSTVGTYRIHAVGFGGSAKLILLSGPASLGSTKLGFSYSDIYSYPDTIPAPEYIFLDKLAIGTYQYKIIDTCGHEIADSIVIDSSMVTSLSRSVSYKKGCLGRNQIYYSLSNGGYFDGVNFHYVGGADGNITVKNLQTGAIMKNSKLNDQFGVFDSALNIPSGKYEITYNFMQGGYGTPMNDSITNCWTIKDTITIPPYQTPTIKTGNYLKCQNGINIELLPDSTKGVAPYQYEIIAGPQTFPEQASNVFSVAQGGIYTARIFDVCGNASTAQITITPVAFPPTGTIAPSCNSSKLFYGSSAYFSYQWTTPNGDIYDGDTLTISPITPADTGFYYVRKITNINGCADTSYTSHHLSLVASVTQTIPFCKGTDVHVGTHTYNTPGIYVDTLSRVNTLGCDSVVTTYLLVLPQKKDTNNVGICRGGSVKVGANVYSVPGIYVDSVQNAYGCFDLIYTNLFIQQSIDTFTISICHHDSIQVGTHVYTAPGTYADTLTSYKGCDSVIVLKIKQAPIDVIISDVVSYRTICQGDTIRVLNGNKKYFEAGVYQDTTYINSPGDCIDYIFTVNITVSAYKKDSITKRLCAGQSFTVGTHTYSTTGIYRDTLTTTSCDSIVTLNLTIDAYKRDSVTQNICSGQSFSFNGKVYGQTGVYRDTLSTSTCDSIAILNLIVGGYKKDSVTQSICAGQSFSFNGNSYTKTGIYRDTLSTSTCDSIAILNLIVGGYKKDSITQSICAGQSFSFNGTSYTKAGIYRDTLSTSTCDSIAVLNLIVTNYKKDSITRSVCAEESYTFNGNVYTQTGIYRDTFPAAPCDSISILNLTILPQAFVDIIPSALNVDRNDTIQLNVTPAARSYLWTATNALISNTGIKNPFATIPSSSWIYVKTASTIGSCIAVDSVFITVNDSVRCNDSYIYLPNAFTPNGDGLNDLFRIQYKNITLKEFQIFNRWGERVFKTSNIKEAWDGKHKGEITAGNYVYWVSYHSRCDNNIKLLKGNIILIR